MPRDRQGSPAAHSENGGPLHAGQVRFAGAEISD